MRLRHWRVAGLFVQHGTHRGAALFPLALNNHGYFIVYLFAFVACNINFVLYTMACTTLAGAQVLLLNCPC